MLFRNTMAQSAGFALGYLFSFLLAPLMISRLGLDAFGVWAVTGAFATYAGLLDLGIGQSLSRFIAVFDAEGRRAQDPRMRRPRAARRARGRPRRRLARWPLAGSG